MQQEHFIISTTYQIWTNATSTHMNVENLVSNNQKTLMRYYNYSFGYRTHSGDAS